ncbi:myo-inositol 2-dehydrogenase [Penicillium argentinense]|uniref:Myo-inositol 2-dehydrogenase n=1 Tax=Penicillium argentinense TaxID=1131581 RepID=A0A9W9K1C2_9EURO|nr:myo-inositol 2-dehydrogenase [Penicillium argentinense]KAJ5089474.1 myo-inositol 2-dehydrogenase [Penicillium argentinense]
MTSSQRLGVGIIGAGEVFQVCHGPCLLLLSHLFKIESICDLSPTTVDHCAAKFSVPHKTTTPQEVIDNQNVQVVFILTSDESHAPLAISGLKAGKNVFIEKPVSLSLPSVQSIIDAEKNATGGARVFVGYMRRYAPSYINAFKREIASIPKILYARVRDFSGPNAQFVDQSGTFQVKNSDYPASSTEERNQRLDALFKEAFPNQEITEEKKRFPESVDGVSVNDPFYSAIMTFRNQDGSTYSTTYESGIDKVPIFDAHITVYGDTKRVTIKYDSPYVKGLPIYVEVEEVNEHGEVQRRNTLSSYEDAYTAELQVMHDAFVNDKDIKTTVEDAKNDLQIYDMMYKKWGGN